MATKPRIKSNRKLFVTPDGETTSRPVENWSAIRYELFGDLPHGKEDKAENYPVAKTVDIPRADFPESIILCAAAHGLAQKIGDTAFNSLDAAAKEDGVSTDPESRGAAFVAMVEGRLQDVIDNLTSGVWTEEREGSGGANVKIVAEAVLRTLTAQGQAPADTDAAMASLVAKLKDDEARKGTEANPAVKVHIAAIKAERAQARAKELAKGAKGQEVDTSALSGLLAG